MWRVLREEDKSDALERQHVSPPTFCPHVDARAEDWSPPYTDDFVPHITEWGGGPTFLSTIVKYGPTTDWSSSSPDTRLLKPKNDFGLGEPHMINSSR